MSFASCEKSDSEEAYKFCKHYMIGRLFIMILIMLDLIFLVDKAVFFYIEIGYVIKW